MPAYVRLKADHSFDLHFCAGENPADKYNASIYPQYVDEIRLSGPELAHAINALGAAPVKGDSARYYGDEARRIFFNWTAEEVKEESTSYGRVMPPEHHAFISKWKQRGKNLKEIEWMTPSRLYWELIYEDVTDWDQVEMAEDLLKLYPDEQFTNSAIQHARCLVASTK